MPGWTVFFEPKGVVTDPSGDSNSNDCIKQDESHTCAQHRQEYCVKRDQSEDVDGALVADRGDLDAIRAGGNRVTDDRSSREYSSRVRSRRAR